MGQQIPVACRFHIKVINVYNQFSVQVLFSIQTLLALIHGYIGMVINLKIK